MNRQTWQFAGICEKCGDDISVYDDFDVYEIGLLHVDCAFDFNFDFHKMVTQ